jgi:hypothetical protein
VLADPPGGRSGVSRRGRRVAALATAAGGVSATQQDPPGRSRRRREDQPRTEAIKVRLSPDARAQLRARAADLGVSVPRLMVEAALSGVETPDDRRREMATLFELRRLLASVANNINQQAKQANISGELAMRERLEATLAEVEAIIGELRAVTGARR